MPSTTNFRHPESNGQEINRLLTAAVVSSKFCKLLLTDPARAIAAGYNGETFQLAREERERVLAIRAATLAEFASQLTQKPAKSVYRRPAPVHSEAWAYATAGLD
jgi:hypothetical protein